MPLRRLESSSSGGSTKLGPLPTGEVLARWPNVHEFLTSSWWEVGIARSTGTVMIFVEGSAWKLWVHDRDSLNGAFLSAGTLEDALERLNAGLESGSLDWRPDRKGKK